MTELLVTSSVLIVVIALLRGEIGQRGQYALWLLVAIRLLVPVSFVSSPLSVMNAVEPVTETIYTNRTVQQLPAGKAKSRASPERIPRLRPGR